MSENGRNMKAYSAADIRKYLNGELPPSEMHAMERAAMDDPLLADAMEGMQNILLQGKNEFEADTKELKKRIENRIADKNKVIRISFKRLWWQVASAVIILAGTGALLYNYLIGNSEQKQNTAQLHPKPMAADTSAQKVQSAPVATATEILSKKDLAIANRSIEKAALEGKPKKSYPQKRSLDKEQIVAKSISSGDSQNKAGDYFKNLNTDSADLALRNNQGLEGKVAGITVQKNKFHGDFLLQGKVIDANQQPIMGATVKMKNRRMRAVTDINGMFKLNGAQQDKAVDVIVSEVGYKPVSAALNNGSSNVIRLNPISSSLNEPVVSEKAGVRPNSADSNEQAFPVEGWVEYKNYVDKNKIITTADSTLKGDEIVSFIVSKKGKLSSFTFQKSLSPAHDAEAMRLIKKGPPWKFQKKRNLRGTVIISF